MSFAAETFFTIGQFADLHEINKKTLMWYDEIGLLKPAAVRENGYRYYTYQQSSTLETILMLRELQVSIREIQEFLKNRSAASLEMLLMEKGRELDHTITHLKKIKKMMSERQRDMSILREMDLSQMTVVDKVERHYLVTVDLSCGITLEKAIERLTAEAKGYQLRRLHDASYGSILPVEQLYQGDFSRYSALYMEVPGPIRKKGLHIQPKGPYLRAFCKGSWEHLPERYLDILSYAREQGFRLSGFAYEKGINEMVIDTLDEYITEIEIPIQLP